MNCIDAAAADIIITIIIINTIIDRSTISKDKQHTNIPIERYAHSIRPFLFYTHIPT